MQKINLFFILAFREQTYTYDKKVKEIDKNLKNNKKVMDTTLTWHYVMLSQYFNLYNFYEYEDRIEQFDNAVIYHLPYGKDDIDTGIEGKLLKFKGKIPIVFRSYDAHSPIKLSSIYLDKYHDLAFTYLQELVNNKNRVFTQISYDNYLITKYDNIPNNRKFACIILRKETRKDYFEKSEKFEEITIKKTYRLREEYTKYREIDVYGSNWSKDMKNYYGSVIYQKKHETLNRYRFNFVIENAIVDNYLSEKILDSFLSLCVPVYIGSPAIDKYIPKECFIDIRDFEDNEKLIDYLKNMSKLEYSGYIKNIKKHRDKIFERFSTKENFAKLVYFWYQENYNNTLDYKENYFEKIDNNIEYIKYVKYNFNIKEICNFCKRLLTRIFR